jgi:hypothetical protein
MRLRKRDLSHGVNSDLAVPFGDEMLASDAGLGMSGSTSRNQSVINSAISQIIWAR